MKKLWNFISNQGIYPDTDNHLARKIKLTNQISFTILLVAVLFLSNGFWHIPTIHIALLIMSLPYLIPIIANKKKWYVFSRFFLTVYATFALIFLAGISTEDYCVSFRFALISVILVPLLVFDITEKIKMYIGVFWVALCFVFLNVINSKIPHVNQINPDEIDSEISIIMNGILTFIMFTLSFNYFQNLNNKAEKKLKEQNLTLKQQKEEIQVINEDLQNKNEEVITQRDQLEVQRNLALEQKDQIENQNKAITASITYAKSIQSAILPPEALINELLHENFILYKPRDIVSGDFYWIRQVNQYIVLVAADCTGHGVPGAFMSMLGISYLNEIVQGREITQANKILNELRDQIKHSLRQHGQPSETKDGMDIALCVIDTKTKIMQYSGAFISLYLIREVNAQPELKEIKADQMPVGFYRGKDKSFTNHEIQLEMSDTFYIFSDGFPDQKGGKENKKFMSKNFKTLLLEIHEQPLYEQKEILDKTLKDWMGDNEQIDDILVVGVRL